VQRWLRHPAGNPGAAILPISLLGVGLVFQYRYAIGDHVWEIRRGCSKSSETAACGLPKTWQSLANCKAPRGKKDRLLIVRPRSPCSALHLSRLISREKSRSDPTPELVALHLHPVAFPGSNRQARTFASGPKNACVCRGARPDVYAGTLHENDVLVLRCGDCLARCCSFARRGRPICGSLDRGNRKVGPCGGKRWIGRRLGRHRSRLSRRLGCGLHGYTRLLILHGYQHRELASDITECKICAGHFCSLSTTRQGGEAAQTRLLAYRYFLPVAREAWNAESNVGCFCCSYNSGCNWLTGGSFAGAAPLGPSSS
jgi:hypothetical protein